MQHTCIFKKQRFSTRSDGVETADLVLRSMRTFFLLIPTSAMSGLLLFRPWSVVGKWTVSVSFYLFFAGFLLQHCLPALCFPQFKLTKLVNPRPIPPFSYSRTTFSFTAHTQPNTGHNKTLSVGKCLNSVRALQWPQCMQMQRAEPSLLL